MLQVANVSNSYQRKPGDRVPGTPILEIRDICLGDVSYSVVEKNLGVRSCAA